MNHSKLLQTTVLKSVHLLLFILLISAQDVYFASGQDPNAKSIEQPVELLSPQRIFKATFIEFSPDGRFYATDLSPYSLAICDAETGNIVQTIYPPFGTKRVGRPTFSLDGKRIVPTWEEYSQPAGIYDTETGKLLCQIERCYGKVSFSPDGERLAGYAYKRPPAPVSKTSASGHPRREPLTETDNQGVFGFWNADTGKRLRDYSGEMFACFVENSGLLLQLTFTGTDYSEPLQPGEMPRHGSWDKYYIHTTEHLADCDTAKQLGKVGDKQSRKWEEHFASQKKALEQHPLRVAIGPAGRHLLLFHPQRFFANERGINGVWDIVEESDVAFVSLDKLDFEWFRDVVLCPKRARLAAIVSRGNTPSTPEVAIWDLRKSISARLQQQPKISQERLQRAWTELADVKDERAYEATSLLYAVKNQAIPFLTEQLKPIVIGFQETNSELINQLESNKFATRENAETALHKRGEDAVSDLQSALKKNSLTLEGRLRAKRIVGSSPPADTIRAIRAIHLLESWATPNAVDLLTTLANGSPEAWITREASAAVNRLKSKENFAR